MHVRFAAAAFAAALLAPLAATAAPYPGTLVEGAFDRTLSSSSAYVGEPVYLIDVRSTNGSRSVYGGRLYGKVTKVHRAGQGRAGEVDVAFYRLEDRGASYRVYGRVVSMRANTHSNALKEAGGTLGGMILGNIIGKTIFHSGGGGLVGAAGGFFLAKNNRQNVTVPAGSLCTVRLEDVSRG